MKKALLISSIAGLLVGAASAHTALISSWFALVPWGVGGLIVGLVVKDRKSSLWSGVWYGFFLCVSFLVGGYKGGSGSRQIFGFILLLLATGVVGALCGLLLACVGNLFVKKNT